VLSQGVTEGIIKVEGQVMSPNGVLIKNEQEFKIAEM
jgi:hypothetical protein